MQFARIHSANLAEMVLRVFQQDTDSSVVARKLRLRRLWGRVQRTRTAKYWIHRRSVETVCNRGDLNRHQSYECCQNACACDHRAGNLLWPAGLLCHRPCPSFSFVPRRHAIIDRATDPSNPRMSAPPNGTKKIHSTGPRKASTPRKGISQASTAHPRG